METEAEKGQPNKPAQVLRAGVVFSYRTFQNPAWVLETSLKAGEVRAMVSHCLMGCSSTQAAQLVGPLAKMPRVCIVRT
jgi:hypothetical protein